MASAHRLFHLTPIQSEMKMYLKHIHFKEFPTDWEDRILNLLPKEYKNKYSSIIDSILREIRDMYIKDMQKLLNQMVLSNPERNGEQSLDFNSVNYKPLVEKSSQFKFLRHCKILGKIYFLHLEPIRFIISRAQLKLPAVICNFEYYRNLGLMSLTDFQNVVHSDIKKVSLLITNQYYAEVSRTVAESKVLRNLSKRRSSKVMCCVTNVFTQQIVNIMIRSIDHMLNTLRNEYHCPQIKFELVMKDGKLLLSPSIETIHSTYHDIIERIMSIAQDLIPLEEWLNIKTSSTYMKIKLPDCYVEEFHEKLEIILGDLFEPINNHTANIIEEFYPICAPLRRRTIILTSGSVKFDLYLQHVQKYKNYLIKANAMVMNTYHVVGKLEQREAKKALKKESHNIINTFLIKLVKYHQEFNRSICADFEELKSKALNIPSDAKALIELTDYISYASRELIGELEGRIQDSINMLAVLLEICILPENHIQLNKQTVNWLSEIEPVFRQNNALCEAMKNEIEDEMQKRISNLNLQVDYLVPQLSVLDEMDDINRIDDYFEYYKGLLKQVNQINCEMQKINEEETLFKFPETEFPNVIEVHEIIVSFYELIHIVYQWKKDSVVWLDGPFEWLNAGTIESKTFDYFDKITEMSKTFRTRIKMDVSANKCFKFSGIADDPEPMQQPTPLKLCWQALNDINEFKRYLPLVTCMCNPALQKRHWVEMSEICNFDLTPNAGTSLRKIISFNLMDDIEKYKSISIGANRESELRQKLSNMIKEWDRISFDISFDHQTGMNVFSSSNDIELLLEDHLVKIEEMRTSNFIRQMASTMTNFFESLTRIQEIINQWNYIQMILNCLSSVLNYPTIEVYLGDESLLYEEVENSLKSVQNGLSLNPTFAQIDDVHLLESLFDIVGKLEHINKVIKDYIETKRLRFPRFYFLSDKEVREVLFESNNFQTPHLQKCFEGILKIKCNKRTCIIVGDCNEELYLEKVIDSCSYPEEDWLIHLENEMKSTMKNSISECHQIFSNTFDLSSIINFPSMSIVCAHQLHWTTAIHRCLSSLDSESLSSLHSSYIDHLNSLTAQLKNYSTKRLRNLLTSLIIIVIQQRDVIQLLLEQNSALTDFEWVAQLRYYLLMDYVNVSIFNTNVKYGYEYSYYKQHIIHTPLTNRCFHVLMQAYNYHLYGAVVGPSATGKSETVKSLAKAMAVQFRSFNCASVSSYDLLSQIFRGFITCGTWLCFENFDELPSDLLSRITEGLTTTFQAIARKLGRVTLEGVSLKINPTGHISIVTKLDPFRCSNIPDNLKVLFRTTSMIMPDTRRIVEVEISAGGVINSKLLASKLITLYEILSDQLWCESCNNFNMYSIKAIIRSMIYLKRSCPEEDENVLLLRSLIDIILPRLCRADIHIFTSVMRNVFPDTNLSPPDYTTFLETLEAVCESRSIRNHDSFKLKILQLFELVYVYQSLVIIGKPLVGKTEILNVLRAVLSSLHEQGIEFGVNIELERIFPSAIDTDRLFGHFDEKTNIWKDGVCSKVFRSFSQNKLPSKKWIIFDGPMKNTWIDNLHTIVDNSKTLHLASGENINTDSVSVIFETMNIENVSPAIVSACGVIYVESDSIDWRSYVETHFSSNKMYNGYEGPLFVLFNWAMEPALQFLRNNCTAVLATDRLRCVTSTLDLFEMYLSDALTENGDEKAKTSHFLVWAQAALILSITWGLGGKLNIDSHVKFNSFCVSFWGGKEYPKPEVIKNFDVTLPHEGLIQDNFYIFKGVGNWKYWGSVDILKNEQILDSPNYNEIFVPTVNTIKYNHLLLKHVKHKRPFVICGDTSIGKTMLIRNFLKNKLPEGVRYNLYNFILLSKVVTTQKLFLSRLNKIEKKHYGPPKGQFCVNFIDDLNIQRYNDESEINSIFELLRQYHNCGYFYDVDEPEKVYLRDIVFSLSIVESSAIQVCPRFLRHFSFYTIYTPTTDNIFRIFSNVLFNNLKRNSFTADVFNTVTNMTNATIDVYNSVTKTLRPVPAKFQYLFSLRDMSKAIEGCSLLCKESVETKIIFVRIWAHEIWRVFGDRILDGNDKQWLFSLIREVSKRHFKDSFETVFDYLPKSKNEISKDSFNHLMFSSFMNDKNGNGRYEEIISIEKLKNKILSCLNEYNNNNKKRIDIVTSQYVLECLIKISRILTIPGGNLLMIAGIGFGRKSLASLAAFVQHQELFEPPVQSYRDFHLWRKDLKTVLRKCGGLKQNLILFLKDKGTKGDFLHDISCLLATGEIPDLFSVTEKCEIIEMVRLDAQGGNKNEEISNQAVMSYFLEQCNNKLHIMICFNETNASLRSNLHKYPELVKYCTMNWYEIWPMETFVQIGSRYIQQVNVNENLKTNVTKACIKLHKHMDDVSTEYYKQVKIRNHVTLAAFLHTLKLYVQLLGKKQRDIVTMRNRYLAGLDKLELAAGQVEKMKNILTMLKPQLESSAEKMMITMREVESENVSVEKATALVQREKEIANEKTEIAGRLKTECEADLAVAIPILEDAVGALNTLKPTDITLVKAMKNPPDTVKLVMAAICVMLDVHPDKAIDPVTGKKYIDYWTPSKRILSDMNFLQTLKDYDKDDIPSNVVQVVKKTYISDSSFKPHIVAKASSAAEGLCKWVRAMVSYDEVAKAVAPKKEKLLIAQKECNEAEAFLKEKQETLDALNAKLEALNSSLRETQQQKIELEREVEDCTVKLRKAENLMASLGGEKDRWAQSAGNLKKDYDNLVGDMILTCGVISYAGSYNVLFRNKISMQWKNYVDELKIPRSKEFDFSDILGEANDINYWHFSGLPKNSSSVENAIIMNNSELWPLLIDSQNEANQWIRRIEKKNDLKIVKLTDSNCLSIIEFNAEHGIPTLIENVREELEMSLDPFLLKNIYNDGKCFYLDTGSNVIKYSFDFRLYITSQLLNPQFSCETFSKLTIIDFSIPNEALQDKLLDFIVSKEKPELQEKFEALFMENANNKKILRQQEDIVLGILSSTTTNILEDEVAIRSLDNSKTLSLNIIKKQEATKQTSLEINQFRYSYVQFVKYCADLFNVVNSLSNINHMYRFSFSWFMQLYRISIETSNKSAVLEKRLKFLKRSFTQNLHSSICRSLSEKHKVLYSFLLCSKILLNEHQTTEEEINYFMAPDLTGTETVPNYPCNWLPTNTWINICHLSETLPEFHDLANDFCSNSKAWEHYHTSEPLEDHSMPEPWLNELSSFQKLIIIKILRPDEVLSKVIQLIEDVLGNVRNSPRIKISESYAESSCLTPILFILPSRLTPLSLILSYAKAKGYSSKFVSLSMSKGHERNAELLIQKAVKEGSWVFLQNCHLMPDWLIRLEKVCEDFATGNVPLDFRLWLSSYPIKEFPISILQSSIKIMQDRPLDVKETLLNIYQSEPIIDKEFFEGCPGNDKAFSKLLFGICLFHVIVEERKNFGIRGWSTPYKFDHVDLQTSVLQLQTFINDTDRVPYHILSHLIGECNYGGKIEDRCDAKCLKHLLSDYCNSNIVESDRYTFSNDIEEMIPQRCEYDYVIEHIKRIPPSLSPEVFGSDKNGLVIRNATIATEFLSSFASINTSKQLGHVELQQDLIIIIIDGINEKLYQSTGIDDFEKCTSTLGEPLQRVLVREIKSLKRTLEIVTQTLNNLKSALNGSIHFTDSLKELAEEIYQKRVPSIWKEVETNIVTENLTRYVENLVKRANFLKNWTDQGCSRVVRFDALFHCKMFISAILLTFSEKYNTSVEQTFLNFQVMTEDEIDEDTDGYLIQGLHLSGARWDLENKILIENCTNETWQEMPPIRLKYSRNKEEADNVYRCPIFAATVRRRNVRTCTKNYIISVPLRTRLPESHWIKRGTALFSHVP
ncbi:dynein heavy chain 12, axonemal-like [Ceratina calcarata]|uniref:Dynein heavy chain 12, axonemal-like n=1 Tax=Ceratina calcarata TaxID=156304 RepID=A0AAJ7RY14_9HYME|nr:dynein heavy chain 12, axonemal-like [Ceratina calcarata]